MWRRERGGGGGCDGEPAMVGWGFGPNQRVAVRTLIFFNVLSISPCSLRAAAMANSEYRHEHYGMSGYLTCPRSSFASRCVSVRRA